METVTLTIKTKERKSNLKFPKKINSEIKARSGLLTDEED